MLKPRARSQSQPQLDNLPRNRKAFSGSTKLLCRPPTCESPPVAALSLTRAVLPSPSPVANKRANDALASDTQSGPEKPEQLSTANGNLEYSNSAQGIPLGIPHMMPPLMPGFPHGIPPMPAPYMMPYGTAAPPGFHFHPPPAGFHPIHVAPALDSALKDKNTAKSGDASSENNAAADKPDTVKISPRSSSTAPSHLCSTDR